MSHGNELGWDNILAFIVIMCALVGAFTITEALVEWIVSVA